MNNRFYSIIIPMYNSQNYIEKLLIQIANQTYCNFEVILVDDGSNDNTAIICNEFAQKDTRFRYFKKDNGGASSARNLGLKKANYEYVTFIDSDDEISLNYIETFDSVLAKNDFDFISSPLCAKHIKKKPLKYNISMNKKEDLMNAFFKGIFGNGPTSKIFKKSIIEESTFSESLTINEDKLFLFEYLLKCKNGFFNHTIVYKYNFRCDSVSHKNCLEKTVQDMLKVHILINSKKNSLCKYRKNHNLKILLYLYKMNCRVKKFSVSSVTIGDFNFKDEINKEKQKKGPISFKIFIECLMFNHLNKLYNSILKKYYKM